MSLKIEAPCVVAFGATRDLLSDVKENDKCFIYAIFINSYQNLLYYCFNISFPTSFGKN